MGNFNKNQIEIMSQNKPIVDEAPYSINEQLVLSYYIEIAETYFPKIGNYKIYKEDFESGFANYIIIQIIDKKNNDGTIIENGPFVMISMLGRFFSIGYGKTVKTKSSFLPIDNSFKTIMNFENSERTELEDKMIGILNYLGFKYTKTKDYNSAINFKINTLINEINPSIEWDLLYNIYE